MTSLYICVILFSSLCFFFFTSLAVDVAPPTTPLAPDNVCNATLDPKYCKSVLPRDGRRHTIYDYCRSSVSQSLRSAWRFSSLIEKYLRDRSSLSNSAVKALEDCKLLAGLNIDFLQSSSTIIDATQSLRTTQTDYLQSMLSAILTNHQTCLDGIQTASSSWSLKNGVSAPLNNGSKLYSVSLALFTRGWGDKKVRAKLGRGRKLLFSDMEAGQGKLPLRMSDQHQEIYESVSGRKLLQASDSVIVRDIVVVNPDGSQNFTSIMDAVAAAPNNTDITDGYFVIYVVAGVYEEYVSIDKKKKNLMIIGDGINQTVITGNRSVVDGSTTFNSATLAVVGQGFVATNITVRNTAGAIKHQAVAVRNGADLSTFYQCSFEGYQDTLYTHSMRQFYRQCDIYGTVDFIFGNAAVIFQDCNLYARLPMAGQYNALTAQGRTDPNQNTGILIHNCNVRAAPDLASSSRSVKSYLGRPWKEYSRTVYMQSSIDSLIDPTGWAIWSGDFALGTLYYAEYNNREAGASTANRVTWPGYHVIGATDASNFTVSNFFLGDAWLPATGVPFDGGL